MSRFYLCQQKNKNTAACTITCDYAVIGARQAQSGGTGAAYVFHFNGMSWVEGDTGLAPLPPGSRQVGTGPRVCRDRMDGYAQNRGAFESSGGTR